MPGRTPPGMYVLAATLLLLVACHATPVFDLPPECTQTRMTNAAQVAFESFADAAATCWSSRTPNASADITSEGMAAHIRRGTKPQCFVEFILEGGNFVIGRRLSNNRVCEQSRHRASAIRLAINFIWVGMTTPAADGALRFWWDITAGSVINSDLYNYLQYPVLTAGRSPKDPCAFPVPHVYFFYAMVGANPGLLTQFAAIAPRKEVHHAVEMARVLGMRAVNVPWSDKAQAAVYRGSCYPTANPDSDTPGYLMLRGALCVEATRLNSPFIDVGTGIDPDYVQDAGSAYCSGAFYKPLCDECAPCNASRPMGRAEMGAYKYQISAEGYGPTADAIYWKLKSNSVVMHIVRDDSPDMEPYYTTWFYKLLTPFVHFVPIKLGELGRAVQYCIEHDSECQAIAQQAVDVAECEMSVVSQAVYVAKVLQFVGEQRWQREMAMML